MTARVVRLAIVVVAALLLQPTGDVVGTEEASANLFAYRAVSTSCQCNIRGTRSSIRLNAALQSGPSNVMLTRVVTQGSFNPGAGLMQIGAIRVGTNETIDDCGYMGSTRVIWEWRAPGGVAHCSFGVAITSFPDTSRYTVARSGETTSWSVFFRGVLQREAVNLGWDVGVLAAGQEIYQNSTSNDANTDYGVPETPFQRTSTSASPWTWTTIQTTLNQVDSSFWTMGTPTNPASPFALDYHNP